MAIHRKKFFDKQQNSLKFQSKQNSPKFPDYPESGNPGCLSRNIPWPRTTWKFIVILCWLTGCHLIRHWYGEACDDMLQLSRLLQLLMLRWTAELAVQTRHQSETHPDNKKQPSIDSVHRTVSIHWHKTCVCTAFNFYPVNWGGGVKCPPPLESTFASFSPKV